MESRPCPLLKLLAKTEKKSSVKLEDQWMLLRNASATANENEMI